MLALADELGVVSYREKALLSYKHAGWDGTRHCLVGLGVEVAEA